MNLTNEQREIGQLNFLHVLGQVHGDFLKKSVQSTDDPSKLYFGIEEIDKPIKVGIVGTGAEGRQAMIEQSPPKWLEFVAFHDIRPSSKYKAKQSFEKIYGKDGAKKVKECETWEEMRDDPDIEAIIVATPLWQHHKFSVEAMKAGKHVLCEKLIAHNITQAKDMVNVANDEKRVLAVGHQRHYSTLYANVLAVVKSGLLGDIRHINAFWHRNNTYINPKTGKLFDSWKPKIFDADREQTPFKENGYDSIEELVRWRLFKKTGAGLMAELGSHQLDACSIFLGKIRPLAVSATGGQYYYTDGREVEDHVFCNFEFPLPGGDPKTPKVVVTYSTISTNANEGYGEVITGSRGTLVVHKEQDVMLFREAQRGDKDIGKDQYLTLGPDDKTMLESKKSSLTDSAALAKLALEKDRYFMPPGGKEPMNNRGYHEEMKAFAFAIKNPDYKVKCDGQVALADAVMALSANQAMYRNARIEFRDSWYQPKNSEVPEEAS